MFYLKTGLWSYHTDFTINFHENYPLPLSLSLISETKRLFLILRSISKIPVEDFEPVVGQVVALSGIPNKAVGK